MTKIIDPVTGDVMLDILACINQNLLDQKCLDHGFVRVLDCMPRLVPFDLLPSCDFALADAARISYQKGTRKLNADAGLIDHLIRNQHCYDATSEVLTSEGWKRWCDLGKTATFAVPDFGVINWQTLPVEVFDKGKQTLVTFKNSTTSFRVTSEHRLWFKEKVQRKGLATKSGEFAIHRANACPKWGWFSSAATCRVFDIDSPMNFYGAMVGFYLGDGCHASKNTISFHLRKVRKKKYLEDLLKRLEWSYTVKPSSTYSDARVYYVTVPASFWESVVPDVRASEKDVTKAFRSSLHLDEALANGVLDGLRNSDGSRSTSREQWGYASSSLGLVTLYEMLNAFFGVDCRRRKTSKGVKGTVAYLAAPKDVESRKSYWGTASYTGKTYCATTATGLLLVRGRPGDCALVSGNTSPIEMGELKFHIRLPIFVMRQHVRHRMASLNEESARYSELASDFYIPDPKDWAMNTAANKQATLKYNITPGQVHRLYEWLNRHNTNSYELYQKLLEGGEICEGTEGSPPIAREQARMVLGVNIYTQCVWKIDLKNLLHYLKLRTDAHAQYEIRVFADAIARVTEALFPAAWKSFKDNFIEGANFSATELVIIRTLPDVANNPYSSAAPWMRELGWTQRRFGEFRKKVSRSALLSERDLDKFEASAWPAGEAK